MAVDTREKRFSMMNLGTVGQMPGFTPDSSVDADDRAHLLDLYNGIALSAPVSVVTVYVDEGTVVMATTMGEGIVPMALRAAEKEVKMATTIDEAGTVMR